MSNRTVHADHRSQRSGPVRRAAVASLVAVVASGGLVTLAGATGAQLLKATVKPYSGILENAKHHTLYALTSEKGGRLRCKAACTPIWFPFLVKSSVTTVSLGAGVAGKIGFVKRSATTKQVTFNSYPVYAFSGDGGPGQVNGQGIAADGGTWYLVNATAKSSSKTLKTGAN